MYATVHVQYICTFNSSHCRGTQLIVFIHHWYHLLYLKYFYLFQLSDLVSLVRGKLTKLARIIMSALIVIEVHSRDVVGTMVEQGVKNVNDFEWISQLRFLHTSSWYMYLSMQPLENIFCFVINIKASITVHVLLSSLMHVHVHVHTRSK